MRSHLSRRKLNNFIMEQSEAAMLQSSLPEAAKSGYEDHITTLSSARWIFALAFTVLSASCAKSGGDANVVPQLPVANVSRLSVSCPPLLIVSPAFSFPDKNQDLTLSDSLQVRKDTYVGCSVVSQTHPPATWSKTGGSIDVIRGGRQAIFSSSRFGTFTVSAKVGKHTARATLVVQRNNERVLTTFPVNSYPNGGLIADRKGALYGVTEFGGKYGFGTVFELRRGASTVDTIYNFRGAPDGEAPIGALISDNQGDFFGTTKSGGNTGASIRGKGTVFELMPSHSGYTERVIHRFRGGKDGESPQKGLAADPEGALYGTTQDARVFKLTPSRSSYVYTIIYDFRAVGAGVRLSNLVIDNEGSLYGTYDGYGSGAYAAAVFKLTRKGSSYVESTLYTFPAASYPGQGIGVVLAGKGVLYGVSVTFANRTSVFALVPRGDGFVKHTFYSFRGDSPGGLTVGLLGVLYGTTSAGVAGFGNDFALAPSGAHRNLHTFEGGTDGANPIGSIVQDATGAIYGVTQGGYGNDSTIYEILPNHGSP